jgi:hypothetical protein
MKLRNLTNDHAVVEDSEGNPYAFNHKEQDWFSSNGDTVIELNPIDKNGVADFETIVRLPKKYLTAKFVQIDPNKSIQFPTKS